MTHDPREALKPFAACVFDDNGDITVDTSHLRAADYVAAKKALTASLPGEQNPVAYVPLSMRPQDKGEPLWRETRPADATNPFKGYQLLPLYTSAPPDAGWDRAAQIVRLIDDLRSGEGDSVTILCDNPDFNGQPNCAVICNADWTDWQDRRFAADTILDALCMASTEKQLPSARPVIAESNGHHWVQRFNLTCCRDCGIVRRADDSNSPCKGAVGLSLRRESPASEEVETRDQYDVLGDPIGHVDTPCPDGGAGA